MLSDEENAWKGNFIHYEKWDEIIYTFLNLNVATIEDYERISISSHTLQGMGLLSNTGIKDKPS